MVKRIALVLLMSCLPATATITLVQREAFQAVGTLDTNSPGNLGTVLAGSFYKRATGPRLTNDTTANLLGWSADFHLTAAQKQRQHQVTLSGQNLTNGLWSAWYFIVSITPNGSATEEFGDTRQGNGTSFMLVKIKPGSNYNFWTTGSYNFTDTDSGVAVPVMQWFELRHNWELVSVKTYNYKVQYRLANSTSWVTILSGQFTFQQNIASVRSGQLSLSGGSAAMWQGRYGLPSLYACTSLSTDSTNLISDVVDPLATRTTWYLNPDSGSDSADGVTSGTAWKTAAKVNEESSFAGMLPSSAYATGDTLIVDTSTAPLVLGTNYLGIATQGLTVTKQAGQAFAVLQADKTVANGSFSLVSGLTAVYQTSDSDTSAVLWEDDKWLNHPTGATFASVSNSLQTVPGSFWTDGTTMYVHPFGDSSPMGDGKVYTRSYNRLGSGQSSVILSSANVRIDGIYIRKTCLADKSSNDPIGAYCIQGQGSFGGTSLITDCYADYGSKHIVGFTDNNSNAVVTIRNCRAEQGSPYGNQTVFVSYNGGLSGLNNTHLYVNCTNRFPVGLVGSTNGATGGQSFYSHNNGGSNQFGLIRASGCVFGGNVDSANSIVSLVVSNTSLFGSSSSAASKVFVGCSVNEHMLMNGTASESLSVTNCLFRLKQVAFSGGLTSDRSAIGNLTFISNTFDLTDITSSGDFLTGPFKRTGALNLVFKNNAVIFPNSPDWSIISNGQSTDTMTFENNVYRLGSGLIVSSFYISGGTTNNYTLAQWQSLGFEAASVNANPCLGSNYRPYAKTPCWTTGAELGPAIDFTGKLFQSRKTAGAYEFVIPEL